MMKRTILTVVLLVAAGFAQNPAPGSRALQSAGHFNGQRYTNRILGFTVEFPAKWTVQDAAEMEQKAEAGHRALYGRDPEAEEEHEQAEKVVVRLAAATPPPNPGQADARGIQIIAVPRSHLSPADQKNFTAAAVLQNPALVAMPLNRLKPVKIGQIDFAAAGASLGTIQIEGQKSPVYLAMYATIRDDNALVFGITAADEKELAEVAKTLETVHFVALK